MTLEHLKDIPTFAYCGIALLACAAWVLYQISRKAKVTKSGQDIDSLRAEFWKHRGGRE